MNHLTNINDIEQSICNHRFCLFYIKSPDANIAYANWNEGNKKKEMPYGCLQFMPVACYAYTVGENTLKKTKESCLNRAFIQRKSSIMQYLLRTLERS